jgi:rhomboid protease GluP
VSEDPELSVAIYRSAQRSACEERSFMLMAVGIGSVVSFDGSLHVLCVQPADEAAALDHLRSYASETRRLAMPAADQALPHLYRHAWAGCVGYVAVLYVIAWAVSTGAWRVDMFDRGELQAEAVNSGQWWRAWTALTLHRDGAHLFANLGGGVWFGYLAARLLGVGTAWLLIVTGAAAANLFDGHWGPASYQSVGASTAVFTALGLSAAYSWRTRLLLPQRWAQRWAPLIGGVVLLGWFGSAGEGTDLVAHALGFTVGCLLGAVAAMRAVNALLDRVPQAIMALAAVGSIALCWVLALRVA